MTSKQTTMGDYFSRASKDKDKKGNDKEKGNSIDRRTRFSKTSAADGGQTSSDTFWSSWMFTDWRKKDSEDYRNGYPGKKDDPNKDENWRFYNNEIRSYPDGDYITNIHQKWFGDYQRLERHHGYIQWLFPLRESAGMNFHAQELQMHEIEKIKENPKVHHRVMKSYEMMLDFYGMKIKDKMTGELEKNKNWKERFAHLNRSYHNYLRITRILKCLGEMGYEHIKVKFLEFIIEEALEKKTLKNCYKSCKDYWVETLRIENERQYIQDYMRKVENGYESDKETDEKYHYNLGEDLMDESQEMKYIEETVGGYDYIQDSNDTLSGEDGEAGEKMDVKTEIDEKVESDLSIDTDDKKAKSGPDSNVENDNKSDTPGLEIGNKKQDSDAMETEPSSSSPNTALEF